MKSLLLKNIVSTKLLLITILLMLLQSTSFASVMRGTNSYWKCAVYDKMNKQWTAQSPYSRTAINMAYSACKKQSDNPKSCMAATEQCEAFINGETISPIWRCTASDSMANNWRGDTYKLRDDAAIGAKEYCKHRSSIPDSCYVSMLSCTNLNSQ